MEGSTVMPRKRATMMIDSDEDEEGDLLSDLPRPVLKKTRRDVEDIAEGPEDYIKALTEAGFHPRSGDLPNILSKQFDLKSLQSSCSDFSIFFYRCTRVRLSAVSSGAPDQQHPSPEKY